MSAETILDTIAARFASDPNKGTYLSLARARTGANYGSSYDLAVALRAAHMMTLSARNEGEAGPVTQKREGALAVSFAEGDETNDDLAQTHFGRQLAGLRRGKVLAMGVTGRNV